MIVIQILAIPIVLFLLLCIVFIIASVGTEMPNSKRWNDQHGQLEDDTDQTVNSTLPTIPLLRI